MSRAPQKHVTSPAPCDGLKGRAEDKVATATGLHPERAAANAEYRALFDAMAEVLAYVMAVRLKDLENTTRGPATQSAVRSLAAYLLQAEGDIPRDVTARFFKRDETTFRTRNLQWEDDRDGDYDLDAALSAIGEAMRSLAAMQAAFAELDPIKPKEGRPALLAALRSMGKAVRRSSINPVSPPDVAPVVQDVHAALQAILDDPHLAHHIAKARSTPQAVSADGRTTLRFAINASKQVADDALARAKKLVQAAGMRIVFGDVFKRERETGARLTLKVIDPPAIIETAEPKRR